MYRAYAQPLRGITPIPESAFAGRDNTLFACSVDLSVLGEAFLPSYTEGDNRAVVATDSLRNFVHATALDYAGATLEGFVALVGERLLRRYAQIEGVRVRAREVPFVPAKRPDGSTSAALFGRSRADVSVAEVTFSRRGGAPAAIEHRSGREGLELARLGGSAFAGFVRDEFTTLPEAEDRPLYVHLDVRWRYVDVADAIGPNLARYVAAEQVRDLVADVFGTFASRSIQHLVHAMGQRLLARFPQLAEVSLEAQNRLWDAVRESASDPRARVYTDPRPTYGRIALTLRR